MWRWRHIYSYQQVEHSDCGLACIRILCRYHGLRLPMSFLRGHVEINRLGASVRDIVGALRGLHMEAAAVRVGMEHIAEMPLPSILYWNRRHFVVLYKISANGSYFYIVDPAEGKMRIAREQFEKSFINNKDRGIAILADPADGFLEQQADIPASKHRLHKLAVSAIGEHRKSFVAVCVLMLFAMAADVALPFFFQRTVDEGIRNNDIPLIWLLVGSQLFIFLGNYVANTVINYLLTRVGLQMSIRMIKDYLNKIIILPMSFFAKKVSSDLIQKVDDHNRIRSFLVSLPDTILFTAIYIMLFSAILIYFSHAVFVVFLVFTASGILWSTLFMRRRRELDYACFSSLAENRNNLYELVNGIDEIKANCAQRQRVAAWDTVQNRINTLSLKTTRLKMWQNGGYVFFNRLRDIAITGICATMVVHGEMTIGLMMTVSYIVGRLAVPFSNLIDSINSFQDVRMSYERVEEVMESDATPSGIKPLPEADALYFDSVCFRYPGAGSPMVLDNLSLTIPYGKTTAIVGASGCGKSTLLKLMLGFFTPAAGRVHVGGLSLNEIDEYAWLSKIAVVMQTGSLFSGDILTNIALSDDHPDLSRAQEAAHAACIDDFIENLPMGYNTPIGKIGMEISGGQKQRILIARAIYRNPEIVVLDEATSSLDAVTESRIIHNIMESFRNRTVVVVAHRLSTVRNADNIIVMNKGCVAEQGTHDHLLAIHGLYFELVNNQVEHNMYKAV